MTNRDLTVGNAEKVLWRFCIPLFASVIFQQIYNIADSLVAGKFIGEDALAAVGNSYEITLIFIAFAFGINIGCSVVVSRLFGARDYAGLKTAVRTAMVSCGVICLVLMAAGLRCSGFLLEHIHTPANIMTDSSLYLDIYIWGLPFVFFYNLSNGIFSALGDSRTPFWFLAVSSTANIFVDILFVQQFRMGVAGVAWATFLCQGVSCFLAIAFVLRRLRLIEVREGSIRWFSLPLLKDIAIIAVPSILQQSFISVGNILIQGVINGFGSGVIAGYSASVKLNNLVITSFTTLGNGISNYSAQNLGAGRYDRIREGFRAGLKMVWSLSLVLTLLYFFGGETLVRFFIDQPSAESLRTGRQILRIFSPFYFIISAKLVADGVLKGTSLMGRFMIATLTDLVLRVLLAFLLSGTALGSTGIWCAWPVGWTAAFILSVGFYLQAFESRRPGRISTPVDK